MNQFYTCEGIARWWDNDRPIDFRFAVDVLANDENDAEDIVENVLLENFNITIEESYPADNQDAINQDAILNAPV